jgi:hypothetical protein
MPETVESAKMLAPQAVSVVLARGQDVENANLKAGHLKERTGN